MQYRPSHRRPHRQDRARPPTAVTQPYEISSLHHDWLIERCFTLKGDLRYTPTTVWDFFPWPQAPSPDQMYAVIQIAAYIWIFGKSTSSAASVWPSNYDTFRTPGRNRLRDLHTQLDAAVFAAYDFDPEDDGPAQLQALNRDIAAAPESARRCSCRKTHPCWLEPLYGRSRRCTR